MGGRGRGSLLEALAGGLDGALVSRQTQTQTTPIIASFDERLSHQTTRGNLKIKKTVTWTGTVHVDGMHSCSGSSSESEREN